MRIRNIVGLVAALFVVISAGAHGALGWPAMMAELAKTNVPPDLTRGLRIGWLFGSACMIIFGAVLIRLFVRRLRGHAESTGPAQMVGGGYLLFGLWALFTADFDPFYAVFIVPGLLLLIAGSSASADR